jgi:lipopolysaccharide export system permease protein
MKIIDNYLFRNILTATLFVAVVLAMIVFLTQSLRFLDIVLNAGSSGAAFWVLTSLALPRFFEIILPLSVMAATLFIYNKMTIDSEIIAMRAVGHSSFSLSRPALALGLIVTIALWVITMWIAPSSMAQMQKMRGDLKAEFSTYLFREGVFNPLGTGLTVYMRKRTNNGELLGLMIHDTRDNTNPPSTVLAKRGQIISDGEVQQVVVYSGTRQVFDPDSGILQRLDFERYTIDLPKSRQTRSRWAEPDERTIIQLMSPDMTLLRDRDNLREFSVEIHRRITSPLLALAFPLIALCCLLLGPMDRRGNLRKIIVAIVLVMLIQGLFLSAYNMSRNSNIGLVLMYILTFVPILLSLALLGRHSENLRRNILFAYRKEVPSP